MATSSSDVISGVINVLIEAGLDSVGISIESSPDVDLAPVVTAIDELKNVNEGILDAVKNPNRTAAEELLDTAADAFKLGWYDDALKYALASIEAYGIQAKPHFVAALSCVELGDGEQALAHFQSAVKYAPNGQHEVGAAAAIYGARLALMAGGRNYALRLLSAGDDVTDHRCVEILALESAIAPSKETEEALFRLWCLENGRALSVDSSVADLAADQRVSLRGYEYASDGFGHLVAAVMQLLEQRSALARELNAQLLLRRGAMTAKLAPTATLKQALTAAHYPRPGWTWDGSVGDAIATAGKLKDAAGVSLYATWPSGGISWLAEHPAGNTADMLRASIWGADRLWGAIADSDLVSPELKSQWYRQIMEVRVASDPTRVADALVKATRDVRWAGGGFLGGEPVGPVMRLKGVPTGPIGPIGGGGQGTLPAPRAE